MLTKLKLQEKRERRNKKRKFWLKIRRRIGPVATDFVKEKYNLWRAERKERRERRAKILFPQTI